MRKVSGLEAVYRDYGPKGVKFFFVYKALAHPERDGYLQPITQEERVQHARLGEKRLGASIPFLVDAIDNRLKHALGDRNNSEFIVDPKGRIVRKRTWSSPEAVRKDLEEFLGPVEKITLAAALNLKTEAAPKEVAPRGIVTRVSRSGMTPALAVPQMKGNEAPFYAKLRAEAELDLLDKGKGKLYLGFHLDSIHRAHWNHLSKPLRFVIDAPEGVKLSKQSAEAPKVMAENDVDPREFLLDVDAWPEGKTLALTVWYYACTDDSKCHALQQSYVLHRKIDRDGGRAAGRGGARARTPEEMIKRLMEGDKNSDGKLSKAELPENAQELFAEFDVNKDGVLDKDEIRKLAERLLERRRPMTP